MYYSIILATLRKRDIIKDMSYGVGSELKSRELDLSLILAKKIIFTITKHYELQFVL